MFSFSFTRMIIAPILFSIGIPLVQTINSGSSLKIASATQMRNTVVKIDFFVITITKKPIFLERTSGTFIRIAGKDLPAKASVNDSIKSYINLHNLRIASGPHRRTPSLGAAGDKKMSIV